MGEPLRYAAVPAPLIEGIQTMGRPPSNGGGRLRLDMSLNVWTLVAILAVMAFGFIALDRLNTRVEIQAIELKGLSDRQDITNKTVMRMETRQIILQRDLRLFPLHKHIGASRIEVYPSRQSESYDEQDNR
jgi:hypothetical protein